MAWDYYNGVLIAENGWPPPLPTMGSTYGSDSWPALGFTYPPGWTPTSLDSSSVLGVNLLRDDQQAMWRYVYATVNGAPDPQAIQTSELDAARAAFNLPEPYQTVCSTDATVELSPGTGIVTHVRNVLARSEQHSILLTISVTPFPSLPSSGVYLRHMLAPTAEFPERLYDTFMAIDWQFLVSDSTSAVDSDNDGWLDQFDEFPFDPDRH